MHLPTDFLKSYLRMWFFRPSDRQNFQTSFIQQKSTKAPQPNRPSYSETQTAAVNSFPTDASTEKQQNLLNQMINKLFNTEQFNSANNLPSRPSNRPNQPQPLPYYPVPKIEKNPLDGSSKRKYPSVDLVVGGVRPKPTKKKKTEKKPLGNP